MTFGDIDQLRAKSSSPVKHVIGLCVVWGHGIGPVKHVIGLCVVWGRGIGPVKHVIGLCVVWGRGIGPVKHVIGLCVVWGRGIGPVIMTEPVQHSGTQVPRLLWDMYGTCGWHR